MTSRKLGLIVNPIAGMGGRVGLKGTDGSETLNAAIQLGATPISPTRTIEALRALVIAKNEFELITCPSEMGENEAKECGFNSVVLEMVQRSNTSAADTKDAAKEMLTRNVDLILFAGGDGTARDLCDAVGERVPTLGIPAGVKIHSGVFAVRPVKAGELAAKFLRNETRVTEGEVMDIDEEAFRRGNLSAKLYGYLRIPYELESVQPTKSGSFGDLDQATNQQIIAEYVAELMEDDWYYVLGPGTTIRAVAEQLRLPKTLLGVDVIHQGKIVASDVNENQLQSLIDGKKVKIVVSPIGRQGFIFGRGNQQISPRIIRTVGINNIWILATQDKLASIRRGQPLRVDTGDDEVDRTLSRYSRVITGYREEAVVKVSG
ncbi:MAG TPA: ATP-NAD kinase family protein [Terriglobales bacterium]|nr:ATP-NAD kinase family protein [Terriglobales bacterium]